MPLIPSQRHLFDVPDDVAYFNCAYNSPQLNDSLSRLNAGARTKSHPWERTPAGDFIFTPAGVPHQPRNLSLTEPVYVLAARNDPATQEHSVPYGNL